MNNTITVIGTVHHETNRFIWGDLYNKLCELKPDIILFEIPIEAEPEIMQWLKNNWEKRISVENTAVLKYLENHNIPVRPYDIRCRNDYYYKTNYFEKTDAFENAYVAYFKSQEPNPAAVFLDKLLTKVARYYKFYDEKDDRTIAQINSPDCDRALETFINIRRSIFMETIDTVPEMARFKTGIIRRNNYENKRNKAMVNNILNYNKEYEGKHLVVLCGYWHRFALVKMLKSKQKANSFTLNY